MYWAKPYAGFTAKAITRAVGKPGLSEPTVVSRTAGDHQLKVTLGIDPEKRVCCPTYSVRIGMYGL